MDYMNLAKYLYHFDIGSILTCLTLTYVFCTGGKSVTSSSNTRRKKEKGGEIRALWCFKALCFIIKIGQKSSKKCLKLCILNTSCVSLLLNDESLVIFLMCKLKASVK